VPERGIRLVADLRHRLDAVDASPGPTPVALIEWLDPLFAPGHWVPEQVAHAGARAAIGWPGEPSRELGWDAIARADPEVVVLGLCGFDLPRSVGAWDSFDPPDPLTATTAWRTGQLWAIDGSAYVSRPGPRLVDGIEILASILTGRADSRAERLCR
jgi:iron complex transport system substrate-binding protein